MIRDYDLRNMCSIKVVYAFMAINLVQTALLGLILLN